MSDDPDKWENFETYKGEPLVELPPWLQRIATGFLATVVLSLIFAASGAAAFYLPYMSRAVGRALLHADTAWFAWGRFLIGGLLGVGFAIHYWKKSTRKFPWT